MPEKQDVIGVVSGELFRIVGRISLACSGVIKLASMFNRFTINRTKSRYV